MTVLKLIQSPMQSVEEHQLWISFQKKFTWKNIECQIPLLYLGPFMSVGHFRINLYYFPNRIGNLSWPIL